MARINLLPWRAELRKQRQREFFSIAGGSAMVMLLVVFYGHFHISGMIDGQMGRNQFLEQQIVEVEGRIKEITELEKQKQQLVARMKVIERLQSNRPEIVHVFDELARATPDGLYLTGITQKGTELKIEGMAQSNARVSAMMRNLDLSSYFENPLLNVIQAPDKSGARKFTLSVTQTAMGAEDKNKPEQKR
jgi:type IV pilus assembly protein PilN